MNQTPAEWLDSPDGESWTRQHINGGQLIAQCGRHHAMATLEPDHPCLPDGSLPDDGTCRFWPQMGSAKAMSWWWTKGMTGGTHP